MFDYCWLLRPAGASGPDTAGDGALQWGMLELVHQPVPVPWGCVTHTSMVYTV